MAVRLDIRPRLVLRDEPVAKVRRRGRLPPLAVPAATYWVGMAALTYFFAHLGEHPLDWLQVSEQPQLAPPGRPVAPHPPALDLDARQPSVPLAATDAPAAPIDASTEPEPLPEPAPEPATASEKAPHLESAALGVEESARQEPPRKQSSAAQAAFAAPPAVSSGDAAPRLDFPEFTDSTRAPQRERASAGPRIDALFPRRGDSPRPDASTTAPPPPDLDPSPAPVLTSCEAAIARNNEHYELGAPRGRADITRGAYARILESGAYLTGCSIPARTVFEICAAVKDGRAVGITVVSSPPSPSVDTCVRRSVSRLKFPESPRLDVTRTRFDRAH